MVCLGLATMGWALDAPTGPVVLEVSGNIAQTNSNAEAHFDRQMLLALPQYETLTGLPWIDGQSRFRGPLLRDVLSAVGARGEAITVHAINGYQSQIPTDDAERYAVILAMSRDGKSMRVRDRGPLFVVYPFDDHHQLNSNIYYSRSVWQVARIEVQ